MTPLERLLLMPVFDSEPDGDGVYFFAKEAPADMIWLSRRELESALAASQAIESKANAYVTEQLSQAPNDAPEIELDLSTMSWEWLFQDVVRRSHDVDLRRGHHRLLPAQKCARMALAAWSC